MSLRKSTFLLLFVAAGGFPCPAALAQGPYGEPVSFFTTTEISFPNKNLKSKTAVGQHPDGRVLIQCAQKPGPTGEQITRKFFWADPATGSISPCGLAYLGFMEMTPTRDGNKVLYTKKNKNLLEVWEANIEADDTFSEEKPVNLNWGGEILNPHVFFLSAFGNRVLLFSSRAEGRKDFDIYYSEFKNMRWTPPAPLPNPMINTPANETYPFVDKDGILFFTSDRNYPGSAAASGNEDIWIAQFDYPMWKNAAVAPLPPPFNTPAGNRSLSAACRQLGAGFLISELPDGHSSLLAFQTTLEREFSPAPRYKALLIGVNKYPGEPLETPVPNNRRLKRVLEERYGFQVEVMENPSATDILRKMEEYEELGQDDHLLITLFGHAKMTESGQVEFVGIDTLTGESSFLSSGAFAEALARIDGPRHIFVVMDACFSGLFVAREAAANASSPPKSRHILASTKDERVPDKTLFFEIFVEKLEKGPEMQDEELYEKFFKDFIERKVNNDETLHPTYSDFFSGREIGEKEGFRFITLEEQGVCR